MIPENVPRTRAHCNELTCHRPGSCNYCDRHPEVQQYRLDNGINFTGETNADKAPCPSWELSHGSAVKLRESHTHGVVRQLQSAANISEDEMLTVLTEYAADVARWARSDAEHERHGSPRFGLLDTSVEAE